MKKTFNKTRPLSWSAISSFEYDPEQWYEKYVLGKPTPFSVEMDFGKRVGESFCTDKPMAPVTKYEIMEHGITVPYADIKLIGFFDSYDPTNYKIREYKTGKKAWDQKRADTHGQIDMYLLLLWLNNKIPPEKVQIHIDWYPTELRGDFSIGFIEPLKIQTFETKRTMLQVLQFAQRIKNTVKAMETYCEAHE